MPKSHLEVPVMVCDQFYVLPVNSGIAGDQVRVAFGHGINAETFYHTAISLSRESAIQMRDLLDGAIKASSPAAANRATRRAAKAS